MRREHLRGTLKEKSVEKTWFIGFSASFCGAQIFRLKRLFCLLKSSEKKSSEGTVLRSGIGSIKSSIRHFSGPISRRRDFDKKISVRVSRRIEIIGRRVSS